MNICILMATYNGERYLHRQMDSILAQSVSDFRLVVSDDGSTDGTREILNEYAKKDPERIVLLPSLETRKGACGNFLRLLKETEAELYLFADQDDVWMPEHIFDLVHAYVKSPECDKENPICVFSDMIVVDEKDKIIHASFLKTEKLPRSSMNGHFYFVQNNASGCAMLINRALRDFAINQFDLLENNLGKIPMHDAFFAGIAANLGHLVFVKRAGTFYRRHAANALGLQNVRSARHMAKQWKKQAENLRQAESFANFFADYFEKRMGDRERNVLKAFSSISSLSKFGRIHFLVKFGFLKSGLLRKIVQIFFV